MTGAGTAAHSIVIERVMPHPPERSGARSRSVDRGVADEEWFPVVGHGFNLRSNPMPHWNGVVDCEVARACRGFSPVRPQGRTVAADVVWPARANVPGAGEIIGRKKQSAVR